MLLLTRKPDCMLMRFVDDTIYTTYSRDMAIGFVRLMQRGFPEYGLQVNASKTVCNFDLRDAAVLPTQMKMVWCGHMIDTRTLDISMDVTRYYGQHIGDSMTVQRGRGAAARLLTKLISYMKPKSVTMYLDE